MVKEETFHMLVFFSGRVQGVGFRYHTLQIAKGFDVSGFVRNLPDGRVRLEAEGDQLEVKAFITETADRLSMFIRNTEITESWRDAQFKGFTISA